MNKKIINILFINSILLLICGFSLFSFNNNYHKDMTNIELLNIEKATKVNVKSEDYSYLPENIKEYIEEKYNNDGIVILTEKNKIKNESYLNPTYVEYMQLPEKERKSYAMIPNVLANDYIGSTKNTVSFPSNYNLTNVDGFDYTNALKNQGSLGLCWAFAALSSFETKITKMTKNKVSFSERQIDYATANPKETTINKTKVIAITEQYNPYNTGRILGGGGNFSDVSTVMFYGLSPVLSSKFAYENAKYNTKSLSSVLNKADKSDYLPLSTNDLSGINMVELSKKEDKTEYNNIINYIKKGIMENGSMSVGTAAPDVRTSGVCYNQSLNLINFLGSSFESDCPGRTLSGSHAMAIIGWDDDYEYAYCVKGRTITTDAESECTGNWVSGKGTWILRNSWGANRTYSYTKLAYASYFMDISQFTGIEQTSYDNIYDNIMVKEVDYKTYKGSKEIKVQKNSEIENLARISFTTSSANNYYDIYVSDTGSNDDLKLIKENVYKEYPGMVSIKFDNIVLPNDEFLVKVVSTNRETTNITQLAVFTNNKTNVTNKKAKTSDINVDFISNINKDANVELYTKTKNINNGDTLKYIIKNKDGKEVTFIIENSYVINDNYKTTIRIPYSTKAGTYNIITTTGDNEVLDNNAKLVVTVKDAISLEGNGTSDSPYILKSATDFNYIEIEPGAYYILQNDIDFSSVEIKPICSDTLPFIGHFDGKNYSIANLNINENHDNTGLFGYVIGADIKNIIFTDVSVVGNDYTGVLAGTIEHSNVSGIKVLSGYIQGNNYTGGVFGKINKSNISNITNNINVLGKWYTGGITGQLAFSSITASNNYGNVTAEFAAGGIVGETYNNTKTLYEISNTYNTGEIYSNEMEANGGIVAVNIGGYNFKYLFNVGRIIGKNSIGGIIGLSRSLSGTLENVYNAGISDGGDIIGTDDQNGMIMKNIYYIDVFGDYLIDPVNYQKVTTNQLNSLSNLPYLDNTKWEVFNQTYPTLVNNKYYFVSDVSMSNTTAKMGTPLDINLIITPSDSKFAKFTYDSLDKTIFDVNNSNQIVCNKKGKADLKINVYDGYNYKKNIEITCVNEVTNVELLSIPTKTTYKQLEQLDVTGGKLRVTYDSGEKKDIDITKEMVTDFNSDSVNKSLTLTITYLNYTFNYSIKVDPLTYTVSHNEIEGYTFSGNNTVNYNEDYTFIINVLDSYSKSGMKVFLNGTEIKLINNQYTINNVKNNINIEVKGLVLSSTIFKLSVADGMASIIPVNNTYKTFKSIDILDKLKIKSNFEIKDSTDKVIDKNTNLGTGMIIKTVDNTYTVIIRGEITGNGSIDQGDVAKLYNYYKAKIILSDYFLEAAKIRGSDTINQGDVAKLYNYYKNNIASLEG